METHNAILIIENAMNILNVHYMRRKIPKILKFTFLSWLHTWISSLIFNNFGGLVNYKNTYMYICVAFKNIFSVVIIIFHFIFIFWVNI